MLNIPTSDDNAERVVRELFRVEKNIPWIMAWLKSEEERLHRLNAKAKDIDTLRWNQGALQLLSSLFKHVREAKDTYERLTKGD